MEVGMLGVLNVIKKVFNLTSCPGPFMSSFFASNLPRYHLPIIGFLTHYIEHSTIIKRKIFLYDRGDYNSYRQKLSTIDWDSMFTSNDIDSITCCDFFSEILE
jgi:hypothetical protein